jgi:type I restriction enzyme S subunit
MLFDSPPDSWQVSTLGVICQEGGGDIQTGPFGSQLHASDYVLSGIPSIMPANIKEGRVSEEGIARISEADATRLSKYLTKAGDIVYSRRGDVERCALIRKREEGWLCGTGCLRVRPGSGVVDPDFCSHFLSHPETKEWISRHAVGATMPNLNTQILSALPVLLPSLQEQKAIAHILGTLDDKIALNRKTNETLEAMAKALFKSWFVDFDPIRAKAEGRPTGLPAEISDLFPDSFEDSELGEIPSGWRVHPLSDIFSIQGGSQPPAKTFVDFPGNGYVRLLQIRDFLGDNHLTFVPESKNLRIVGEDDVLIGRYGSGSGKFMEDSLGRPLRGLSGAINVAVVNTLPRQKNMIELIYCMVLSGWFYRQIVGGSSRAVQAGFRKEDLDLIPFPTPPNSILDAFQEIGSKFWHRTKALDIQAKSLCQIRDALLPKLISGEIRIPDAEKLLEEVGV